MRERGQRAVWLTAQQIDRLWRSGEGFGRNAIKDGRPALGTIHSLGWLAGECCWLEWVGGDIVRCVI